MFPDERNACMMKLHVQLINKKEAHLENQNRSIVAREQMEDIETLEDYCLNHCLALKSRLHMFDRKKGTVR